MKLEKQVCSLELSKKLKSLGVKQESTYYWRPPYSNGEEWILAYVGNVQAVKTRFSAFTVAELGEMLPAGYKTTRGHYVFIVEGLPDETYSIQRANTEADARVKMLIYLLEKN